MYFTPNFCAKDFPAENGEFVIFLHDVFLCVVNLEVVIVYSYYVLLYIGFLLRTKVSDMIKYF